MYWVFVHHEAFCCNVNNFSYHTLNSVTRQFYFLQMFKYVLLKRAILSVRQRTQWPSTWELQESTLSLWMPLSHVQKAVQQVRMIRSSSCAYCWQCFDTVCWLAVTDCKDLSGITYEINCILQYYFSLLYIFFTPPSKMMTSSLIKQSFSFHCPFLQVLHQVQRRFLLTFQ